MDRMESEEVFEWLWSLPYHDDIEWYGYSWRVLKGSLPIPRDASRFDRVWIPQVIGVILKEPRDWQIYVAGEDDTFDDDWNLVCFKQCPFEHHEHDETRDLLHCEDHLYPDEDGDDDDDIDEDDLDDDDDDDDDEYWRA